MIQINEVELASNLASKATIREFGIIDGRLATEDDITILDGGSDCYIYTDEAQDIFNRWYDYYYAEIMEIAGK